MPGHTVNISTCAVQIHLLVNVLATASVAFCWTSSSAMMTSWCLPLNS